MDVVKYELNIHINFIERGEHVTKTKRNNRTIADRIHKHYYSNMSYKAKTEVMLRYLEVVFTRKLNWFPTKGGVSKYLIPHVIMSVCNIDFNKHCQIPLGSYVNFAEEKNPTKKNSPRILDAIYLRPLDNKQGGHKYMHLRTGKVITGYNAKEITVTDLAIKAFE